MKDYQVSPAFGKFKSQKKLSTGGGRLQNLRYKKIADFKLSPEKGK